jgi:hypothetical protein
VNHVPDDREHADAQLIDAYLDGMATAREIAALEARLIADPSAARELLALSYIECVVRQSPTEGHLPPPNIAPRRARRRLWLVGALLVAGAALLAYVLSRPASNHSESRSGKRILFFDFESKPSTYPRWDRAKTTDCPPGRAGRGCLLGIRMSLRRDQVGMTLGDWKQPFLTFRPGLQVRFVAWAGASSSVSSFPMDVVFYVGMGEAAEAFVYRTELSGGTRWHEVVVPLSWATGWHSKRRLRPTDQITALHITLPWGKDDVFIIDDFEVLEVKDPP